MRITGNVDPTIPEYVYGDELKVRRVLLNLAHNAVKFTPDGVVDVSAKLLFPTANMVKLRFSITDSGIGIKAADGEKLFQPFSQADDSTKRVYGGSGLGLSISEQLVELMGGSLAFESEPGKGSKFWFDVPFTSEGQ